jgi:serine protease Do
MALGSFFFISPDGYAVTNSHVVQCGVSFKIATDDGTIYAAKVVGADFPYGSGFAQSGWA